MKHYLLFLLTAAVLLAALSGCPAMAAECTAVIPSDGALCRDCALGNLAADALRSYTGADIALFPSGALGLSLPPGTVDETAMEESFPEDRAFAVTELDTAALRALLEESVASIVLGADERIDEAASADPDFLCISGFSFAYDASAPVGERVYTLDTGGKERFTAVLPVQTEKDETACTLYEALDAYFAANSSISPPDTQRVQALGANDNPIVGGVFPRGMVLLLAAVMILFGGFRWRRSMRERTER